MRNSTQQPEEPYYISGRGRPVATQGVFMDKVGSNAGWLVTFDRDTGKSWDGKIYLRKEGGDGKEITVVGC